MALSLALMKNLISMMLMVIIGYVIVKIKFLKSRDAQPLSMLTAYVLTPCLILAKDPQRGAERPDGGYRLDIPGVIGEREVDVEDVLPLMTDDGVGLYLSEVDTVERENGKDF